MSSEAINRASEIINGICERKGECVLALFDADGYPTASTITPSKTDGIKAVTFCTGIESNKGIRAGNNSKACVCFTSSEYNITLVGDIEVITDADVKKEMWYDGLQNHFKDAADPNYCVLSFTTKRYNLFVDWKDEVSGNL